ncbi:MAG: PfkB family carbohydrate kinase [Gelidibacter sp.]
MILTVCPNPSIDTYAWLSSFKSGQANRIDEIKEYAGGKGTHVAMALKELSSPVSLLCNWAGTNGEWIKNSPYLEGVGILGTELKGNNRKCYTFRSHTDKQFNNTELLEPGPTMSRADWESFLEHFKLALKNCSIVCLSGSWPLGAPEDAYFQLLQLCKNMGKKAILDCSGIQLKNALKGEFFGLHINEHEAEVNFGTKDHLEINKQLKGRVSLLAITKGKDGLFLYMDANYVHANVILKEVKSTVGSGDCLTAGIAYAVVNEFSFNEIAAYGVACGAANCMNEDLGILRLEDVQELLPLVELNHDNSNMA